MLCSSGPVSCLSLLLLTLLPLILVPGSASPNQPGLGTPSWELTPPSSQYQWVTPPTGATPTACTTASQCPSDQTCGLVTTNAVISEVCGYLSGYWSANQVCILFVSALCSSHLLMKFSTAFHSRQVCISSPSTTYLNCQTPVTSGSHTGTVGAMYGCDVTSGTLSACSGFVLYDRST